MPSEWSRLTSLYYLYAAPSPVFPASPFLAFCFSPEQLTDFNQYWRISPPIMECTDWIGICVFFLPLYFTQLSHFLQRLRYPARFEITESGADCPRCGPHSTTSNICTTFSLPFLLFVSKLYVSFVTSRYLRQNRLSGHLPSEWATGFENLSQM